MFPRISSFTPKSQAAPTWSKAWWLSLSALIALHQAELKAQAVWIGENSELWSDLGNWYNNVPPNANTVAAFVFNSPSHFLGSLGANQTVDGLLFTAALVDGHTLGANDGFVLTLDGGAANDVLIEAGSGAHTLLSNLNLTGTAQDWTNQSNQIFTAAGNITLGQSINLKGTGGWVLGSLNSVMTVTGGDRNLIVANTEAEVDLTLEGTVKIAESTTNRIFRVAPAAGSVVNINAVLSNGDQATGSFTVGYSSGNTGTVNLNTTKTYTGTTTINNGATLNVNSVINNAGTWDVDGSYLNWNVTNTTMGQLYVGGGGANTESYVTIAEGVTMVLGGTMVAESSNSQAGKSVIQGGTIALNGSRTIDVRPSSNTLEELIIHSVIADGSTAGSGITKTRNGTLVLTGNNTFTGATSINEGELILDYSLNNGSKISESAALNLSGASLILKGNSDQNTRQEVASTTLNGAGSNKIILISNQGKNLELSLGAITRANTSGGTLLIDLSTPNSKVLTSNGNTNGILGGYAIAQNTSGQFFATVTNNSILALNSENFASTNSQFNNQVGQWQIGTNASVNSAVEGTTNHLDLNSLRITGSENLEVVDLLNLRSGGLLIDESTTASGIYGGKITISDTAYNGEMIIHQNAGSAFTITSNIARENNSGTTHTDITKSGSGMLILAGYNTTASRTNHTSSSGTIRIMEGTLAVSGGNAISNGSTVSVDARTGTFFKLLDDESIGNLTGGGTDGGTVDLGSNALTINTSSNQTFSGYWTGNGTIVKQNMGSGSASSNFVTTTVASTGFTGQVIVNGGTFLVAGNNINTLTNATAFTVNAGGALYIDNNSSGSGAGNKIGNSATITLNGANGVFQGQTAFRGFGIRSDQSASRDEIVGTVIINRGSNYITTETTNTASGAITSLTASNLTRNQQSTFSIRGTNLGASSGSRSQFKLATAAESNFKANHLTGGGGAAGSSTISIVSYAIAQNLGSSNLSTTGNFQLGNSLVTYEDTTGFRALDFDTEYNTYANATSTGATNVRDTLSTDNLTNLSSKNINAWVLNNSSTTTARQATGAAGTSLNLRSGTLLFTALDANQNALDSASAKGLTLGGFTGGITTGNGEYIVFQNNLSNDGVTISSDLTSAALFTRSGIGTLTLTGNNSALTDVALNEGVTQIFNINNLGGNDGKLYFAGGTLKLGAGFADDISRKEIIVLGETSGKGNNAGRSAVLDTNGNDTVFNNPISGSGEFVKKGLGTLTLRGDTATTHTGTFVLEQTMSGTNNSALVQLVLDNAGGNAIGGDLQMGTYTLPSVNGSAVARLARSEQIADHAVISYVGAADKYVYFNLSGFNETIAGLRDSSGGGIMQVDQSGGTANTSTLTLAGSEDYYFNGFLRNRGNGSGSVLQVNHTGSGRQTLAGGNILYTGKTTNTAGVLQYRDTTSFDGSIENSAEVEFEHTNATAWNYSGVLSGSGVFVKTGIGTGATTLDANNITTGSVVVKAGELGLGNAGSIKEAQLLEVYAGASFAAASSVSSTHHGTVSGNGTLRGNFVLTKGANSVGHLRPGASTHYASPSMAGNQLGQLTVDGNLTLTGGTATGDDTGAKATLQVRSATLNDAAGIQIALSTNNLAAYLNSRATSEWNLASTIDPTSGVTAHDSISLTGTLTWNAGSTITIEAIDGYAGAYGDVIDLFDWSAAMLGSADLGTTEGQRQGGMLGDLLLPYLAGGLIYDLSAFRTHGLIAIVPEPSKTLYSSAALLLIALRRKRKSRN